MRKFKEIIESISAPNTQNLWLYKGALKYYGSNGWENIFKHPEPTNASILEVAVTDDQFAQILNEVPVVIKLDKADSNYGFVVLKVQDYSYYLSKNIKTNGTASYSTSSVLDTNISTIEAIINKGTITITSKVLSLNEIIELEIGNSTDIKNHNLQTIKNRELFFTKLDYGYGVGSYQPSTGGKVHVITADGVFVFYSIAKDGAITKQSEKDLDNVMVVPEGGNTGQVIKKTANGYEWQNDTDTKYTLPAATKTSLGGIKAGTNIDSLQDDATLATVVGTVNSIISQLKATGVLIP